MQGATEVDRAKWWPISFYIIPFFDFPNIEIL
jgi:hypothetical protein